MLQRAILKIKDDVTKRKLYYKELYRKQRMLQRDVMQIKKMLSERNTLKIKDIKKWRT